MAKAVKSRASKQDYLSPRQLILSGFESPFSNQLLSTNRWVILARSIPWDALVSTYNGQLGNKFTGAGSINPRGREGENHSCQFGTTIWCQFSKESTTFE
jgi:hypothetical protein